MSYGNPTLQASRNISAHEGTLYHILFYLFYLIAVFALTLYYMSTLVDPAEADKIKKRGKQYKKFSTVLMGQRNKLRRENENLQAKVAELMGRKPPPYPVPYFGPRLKPGEVPVEKKKLEDLENAIKNLPRITERRALKLGIGTELLAGAYNIITNPNEFVVNLADDVGNIVETFEAYQENKVTRKITMAYANRTLKLVSTVDNSTIVSYRVMENKPPEFRFKIGNIKTASQLKGSSLGDLVISIDERPKDVDVTSGNPQLKIDRLGDATFVITLPFEVFSSSTTWQDYYTGKKTIAGVTFTRGQPGMIHVSVRFKYTDGANTSTSSVGGDIPIRYQ